MQVTSKLPQVGSTIFGVMSQLADVYGAVNLGQGFPDFPVPLRLQEALAGAVREGRNQYPPMIGVAGLRQESLRRCCAVTVRRWMRMLRSR